MEFPKELKYTKDHEWIVLNGDEALVGITEYAQKELGDIVFVDIDSVDEALNAGDKFGTVEAVKTVSDLYCPISGTVIARNEALDDAPELVNQSPYKDGWMIKLKYNDASELDALMDAEAYAAHVGH